MSQDKLETLPDELEQKIATHLTIPELSTWATSSCLHHGLFKSDLKNEKLKRLLEYVVHGEQDKAEKMLRAAPELLIEKGDVMDYSGRLFHHVSPWECMLWAMDTRYMGQMMLSCIPPGETGNDLRRELVSQYDAMQGSGNDLVRIEGDISPVDMPFDELERCFDNDDALLLWNNQWFYARKHHPLVVLITPTEAGAFDQLKRSLQRAPHHTARKTTTEEHALISTLMGHSLSRKGIHYEQPVPCRDLVKIGGEIDPVDMGFDAIKRFLEEDDALLFWRDHFYYASKRDSIVLPITPTLLEGPIGLIRMRVHPELMRADDLSALLDGKPAYILYNGSVYYINEDLECDACSLASGKACEIEVMFPGEYGVLQQASKMQKNSLTRLIDQIPSAFKTAMKSMPENSSRKPSTVEEYQLINKLFAAYPAFKPVHRCDSHYDFEVVKVMQSFIDRFNQLGMPERDVYWMGVAIKQRNMPAHVFHHFCDTFNVFYPIPDFKAASLVRTGKFYDISSDQWSNVFVGDSLDAGLGFHFGLARSYSYQNRALMKNHQASSPMFEVEALRRLCEVRAADTKLLWDILMLSLILDPESPGIAAA